jgi:uncharacterized protein
MRVMTAHFAEIAFTPSVKAEQERNGSRKAYAAREHGLDGKRDELGPEEIAFISIQDSFYLASVTETGWPYIQHRGGPPGFVRVLSNTRLAFADFRGNRQYITVGNLKNENRVSLFFMDYARKARLKLFGRAQSAPIEGNAELAAALALPGYRAVPERALLVDINAFDWNCSQHITPRFTEEQIEHVVGGLRERIAELETQLAARAP